MASPARNLAYIFQVDALRGYRIVNKMSTQRAGLQTVHESVTSDHGKGGTKVSRVSKCIENY